MLCKPSRCPLWVISGHRVTRAPCPFFPSKQTLADIMARARHVRFTPDSGHSADELACPFCAISGHSLLPYSAIIGAEPSQLDTGRLAGLDVRISAWTSRSGDYLLFMARLW